jgi:hypothetical protein
MSASDKRVPCSDATKSDLEAAKRGGETYDELLSKMLKQYDPADARKDKD